MPARLLLWQRTPLGPAEFTEVKAWAVEKSPRAPAGVKFSFAYVRVREGRMERVYAMDNAHGKGPHEHVGNEVAPLELTEWRELLRAFYQRVHRLRGEER